MLFGDKSDTAGERRLDETMNFPVSPARDIEETGVFQIEDPALEEVRLLGEGANGWVKLAELRQPQTLIDMAPHFVAELAPGLPESDPTYQRLVHQLGQNIAAISGKVRYAVVKESKISAADLRDGRKHSEIMNLRREAKRHLELQDKLPHSPHILGGQLYRHPIAIIQEYVPGVNLKEAVPKPDIAQPADLQTRMAILAHAARTILHVQEAHLIHRDIKPANFMLDKRTGNIRMIDFGFVRKVASEESIDATSADQVAGSPKYMAPELCRLEPATIRSDIFSFGVMASEVLTGRAPWMVEDEIGKTMRMRASKLPGMPPPTMQFDHLEQRSPAEQEFIKSELIDMLSRMLDPDPARRPDLFEITQFFHGNSYVGCESFDDFIHTNSVGGYLYVPLADGKENETAEDIWSAALSGTEARMMQYNFLDRYSSTDSISLSVPVARTRATRMKIAGVLAGAVALAATGAAIWKYAEGKKEDEAVVLPDQRPQQALPPVTLQKPVIEPEQKAPETIDQGGEVSMLVRDGELKGIRLFENDPVTLDMDLIPCYSMDDDGPALTGAMAICSPNQLREILMLDEDAALLDEDQNGQVVQLVQTQDGRSKFLAVSGIFTLIEHEGKCYVYSARPEFIASRFPDLDESQVGHTSELGSEVPLEALENIPAITGAKGDIPPYWPESMRQYSPVEIMNMPLDWFKQEIREAHQL